MKRGPFFKRGTPLLLTRGLVVALCMALAFGPLFMARSAMAQAGGIILNGRSSGIRIPGFLFEPEVPFASLKSAPIWFELEQLLDNPYNVALCSSLPIQALPPNPVGGLVRGTPGNDQGFPSYCTTGPLAGGTFTRRPSFSGVALPPLLVNPLNHNPTTGEEMRLLNINFPGASFFVPDTLDLVDPNAAGGAGQYVWSYRRVIVSPGAGRVQPDEAGIDYNAPIAPDAASIAALQAICITTTEASPAEGAILCGGDPGEPNYGGFGVLRADGYSTPAVPGGTASAVLNGPKGSVVGLQLYDAARGGFIPARDPLTGAGGLRKPSLRLPDVCVGTACGSPANPNYLVNTDPNSVTPSNENDFVRNRAVATALGKALFWDMQVGSDGVQACGTCHFNGTGTDTRTKNQLNPNHLSGDLTLQLHGGVANQELTLADFPLRKLTNPEVSADPACTTPLVANVNAGVLENNAPPGGGTQISCPVGGECTVTRLGSAVVNKPVCDAANLISDTNDVASSMGVVFNKFIDIAPIGLFQPPSHGVAAVAPDPRTTGFPLVDAANAVAADPIPLFQGLRRVEPRNTPTMQAAGFNLDNFWDGRARHDFNGGSVFGPADPQTHVFVDDAGALTPTRQVIRFSSIASLATGPGLSEFEMSFSGRNWAKIGKKLLQAGVTPLANQLVDPTDSVLGPYSNQPGNPTPSPLCSGAALAARAAGKPGLCTSYNSLIQAAFYPALHANISQHLDGCYTDGNAVLHPNQCAAVGIPVAIPVLDPTGTVVDSSADAFDGYVLTPAAGAADPLNTNKFTQMEGNFSLFWGLGIHMWVQILVPDNTPFDQFLDRNPDAFKALGEPGEPLLVPDLPNCTTTTQRNCFRAFGNFRRDSRIPNPQGGNYSAQFTGNRPPNSNATDPLLGLDIFFASNLSLKNPNFRTGRCGECHAVPTLTDHTIPFTFKAQLRDFVAEFSTPGTELLFEPLGRLRVISGFLLESEMNENGQDGVERRIADQSIVPNPSDGLAYPGGLFAPNGTDIRNGVTHIGTIPGDNRYAGADAGYFDNGVYNLGVRPIHEDLGRGGNDPFGWPLSLAALMMKNLAGTGFNPGGDDLANGFAQPAPPGIPLPTFDAADPSGTGGLFEETAQDQQINPGVEGEPLVPLLPPYLAPFANQINVGDAAPELDEVFSGLNTLTDVAMLEGFLDTIGPFNPAGINNESLNFGEAPLMGSWPNVNRVGRMGSFKAPQLRNVELTGPYFHNGGLLTLRQVVDFYVRGGDFPVSNAAHRDFNLVNMNFEAQSNLSEAEKVALVDFLLELTDERNRFDQAPFDHPQVIIPVDGLAPDNTAGRDALLANTMFRNVPQVGAAGMATPEPAFLNVTKVRLSGAAANRGSAQCRYDLPTGPVSHYCH